MKKLLRWSIIASIISGVLWSLYNMTGSIVTTVVIAVVSIGVILYFRWKNESFY